ASEVLRAAFAGELGPLRQPEVGVPPGFAAAHRQLVHVRQAVDPDRLRAEDALSEQDAEEAGEGAGRDHHVRPLLKENGDDLCGSPEDAQAVPAGDVGHDPQGRISHLVSVRRGHGDVHDEVAVERGAQSQELDEVSTARADGENLLSPRVRAHVADPPSQNSAIGPARSSSLATSSLTPTSTYPTP